MSPVPLRYRVGGYFDIARPSKVGPKSVEMVVVGAPVYGGAYSVTVLLFSFETKRLPEEVRARPSGFVTSVEMVAIGAPVLHAIMA